MKKLEFNLKIENRGKLDYFTGSRRQLVLSVNSINIPTKLQRYRKEYRITISKESFVFGKKQNPKILIDGKLFLAKFCDIDSNIIYIPKAVGERINNPYVTVMLDSQEWFRNWWIKRQLCKPEWITDLWDLKKENFVVEPRCKTSKIIRECTEKIKKLSGIVDAFGVLSRIVKVLTNKNISLQSIRSNLLNERNAIDINTFLGLSSFLDKNIDVIRIGSDNERGIEYPNLPFNLKNNEGVEILAMWSTDGYLGYNQFQIWNNDFWLLNKIDNNIRKIFGKMKKSFVERKNKNRISRAYVYNSKVVVRSLEKAGALEGKKTKNNPNVPSWIMNSSIELQKRWISIVFSTEGTVSRYNNGKSLSLSYVRGVEVNLPSEAKGELEKYFVEFNNARTPDGKSYKWISISKLRKLEATRVINCVNNQKCNLMEDEIKMIKKWGIRIKNEPYRLNFYPNGRITVIWKASVYKDAAKLASLIPPLIPEKQKIINMFIGGNPEK
jgi:hypothetical protein